MKKIINISIALTGYYLHYVSKTVLTHAFVVSNLTTIKCTSTPGGGKYIF